MAPPPPREAGATLTTADGNVSLATARAAADALPDARLEVLEGADNLGALLDVRGDALAVLADR